MSKNNYPGVLSRVKAVITDSVVLIAFMFLITYVFEHIKNVPNNARITAFVFIFILYDPIFTSAFGGTIGHLTNGLNVKRAADENKKIIFPFAVIRFIVKALLGWISLLTVSGNEKGKAIHDSLVGSVVVYKK